MTQLQTAMQSLSGEVRRQARRAIVSRLEWRYSAWTGWKKPSLNDVVDEVAAIGDLHDLLENPDQFVQLVAEELAADLVRHLTEEDPA